MILIFIAVYVYVYTYDKFGKIGPTFPRVFKKKRNIEEAKIFALFTRKRTSYKSLPVIIAKNHKVLQCSFA